VETILYSFAIGVCIGFILGWAVRSVVASADARATGVNPTGGQANKTADDRIADLKDTVDSAIHTNAEAAKVIEQLQNLLHSAQQCAGNNSSRYISEGEVR
jgi:hypothetical protein